MTERNYLWEINQLKTRNEGILTDVVYTIHWTLTAGEGAELDTTKPRACLIGSWELVTSELDPLEFTAYGSLTEDQVRAWLLTSMDEEFMREQLAEIDRRLDQLAATTQPLPWESQNPGFIEV
jgi:hypothetical protein